jgi:hypothetical protein
MTSVVLGATLDSQAVEKLGGKNTQAFKQLLVSSDTMPSRTLGGKALECWRKVSTLRPADS